LVMLNEALTEHFATSASNWVVGVIPATKTSVTNSLCLTEILLSFRLVLVGYSALKKKPAGFRFASRPSTLP
jgi:hypothetical protein